MQVLVPIATDHHPGALLGLGRLIDYSDSEEDVPPVVDWETVARAQQPVTPDVLRSAEVGTTFALEDRNCVAHATWRRVLISTVSSALAAWRSRCVALSMHIALAA
ncbi:hypothetical protein AB1Y20_016086 [Prymnesium parvum]|uniref:Uncharacterized protein n=1 Tax=Prymnesium parvum TaxID=97485 RepID=A0AB34JZ05_PRYPA